MTDDKITRLPTGYDPPPEDPDDIRWSIALLADEITELSRVVRLLVKQLRKE